MIDNSRRKHLSGVAEYLQSKRVVSFDEMVFEHISDVRCDTKDDSATCWHGCSDGGTKRRVLREAPPGATIVRKTVKQNVLAVHGQPAFRRFLHPSCPGHD